MACRLLAGTGWFRKSHLQCSSHQFSSVSSHLWLVAEVLSDSGVWIEVLASGVMSKEGGPGNCLCVDWVSKKV